MFIQSAPDLGNQYSDDWLLRQIVTRRLPVPVLRTLHPALDEMGCLSGSELYALQLSDRLHEPTLTQWSPWGERIDHIALTAVWQRAEPLACASGLIALGYDPSLGAAGRLAQFALAYLFIPSTDFYGCPLAMTDGATSVLKAHAGTPAAARALPHLLSTDPAEFWTSGQWMTETAGGSDVGNTGTVARQDESGQWRLYGRKWFTSAATSQMALTLARPEGNPAGSAGLALFYIEPRDERGRLRNIRILRLKDKLGTRKLPTAELWLDGAPAMPVAGLDRGVARIAPMLNITRTWNAVTACSLMRRGLALAEDYAHRRQAFGKAILDQPLHRQTLARLTARWAACTVLVFDQIELLGRCEHGGDEVDAARLRLMTPLTKLVTARHAIAVLSEVLEAFGGAGYVEDTGLPTLLRDAQVLSIWEGTTNILSLDVLRVLARTGTAPWEETVEACLSHVRDHRLEPAGAVCRDVLQQVRARGGHTSSDEAGARGLALTLADALALASLSAHAQWALDQTGDTRAIATARLFATRRINQLDHGDTGDTDILFNPPGTGSETMT